MELRGIIRRAIEIGGKAGFITFDQLDELCPKDIDPEVIESLFVALSDNDIQVVEDDP
jgi:hypothetical protein